MRGDDAGQPGVFSYISPEERVPLDHPLRLIREMVDGALKELSPLFESLYSRFGRPSIAPDRNVLEKPFPTLENLIRAKRSIRLPAVLTRDEVRRILGKMNGTNRIIATLLYGSGMRLLECLRLRINPGPGFELSWPPFA